LPVFINEQIDPAGARDVGGPGAGLASLRAWFIDMWLLLMNEARAINDD